MQAGNMHSIYAPGHFGSVNFIHMHAFKQGTCTVFKDGAFKNPSPSDLEQCCLDPCCLAHAPAMEKLTGIFSLVALAFGTGEVAVGHRDSTSLAGAMEVHGFDGTPAATVGTARDGAACADGHASKSRGVVCTSASD